MDVDAPDATGRSIAVATATGRAPDLRDRREAVPPATGPGGRANTPASRDDHEGDP